MSSLNVIKRDGSIEPVDIEKIHQVILWACADINGVSPSEIEMKAHLQLTDGTKTSDLHEMLIKSASDLISEEFPNYQYVAANLINFALRKEVYGHYQPWTVKEIVKRNIQIGKYTPEITELYSDEELDEFENIIDHTRDGKFALAGMEQFRGKYLVQNRVTNEYYETPQVSYLLISAILFGKYPKETRMKYVKEYYDAISNFDISLPTPIMAGLRTPTKQFSSCVLIKSDDSLKSINTAASSIVEYASRKAGIGLDVSAIRPIGSEIRKGDAMHTGIIPFLKYFHGALKSCSQGGVRGASMTVHYPLWHYEVESLLVLKNNRGTEENRVRHLDYSVQLNKLMYQRLIEGGKITLFSPEEVPDLYEAFFRDQKEFERLYKKYEKDTSLKFRKFVPAFELFSSMITERFETGRIYIMHVDHCNTHSSFLEYVQPVYSSNLCQEITLPTRGGTNLTDEDMRIQLCTLSAINWGNIKKPSDLQRPCELAVRALDALLDYQEYPVDAAQTSTNEFRPLGIGIINLAYWLAKNGVKYSDGSANAIVDEYMQAMSYYLINASIDLAEELGPCEKYKETKYGQGIMPHDTRKSFIDTIVDMTEHFDWDSTRERAKSIGIRNATLMAFMPAETSAQISNSTNGIEPPRGYVSEKASKDGVLKQVVPGIHRYKNKYEFLWDMPSPRGYLTIMGIFQKWMDQSISSNTSYNPDNYGDEGTVPRKTLIEDLIFAYQLGLKTLYYNNVKDGASDGTDKEDAESCDSCKI